MTTEARGATTSSHPRRRTALLPLALLTTVLGGTLWWATQGDQVWTAGRLSGDFHTL